MRIGSILNDGRTTGGRQSLYEEAPSRQTSAMRYTLRQLEYFIAAGETGSITLAAERIAISQPSISAAIAHLEREWTVQLFIRHHAQGLSLTPTGRTMLWEAKTVVHQAAGLYAAASASLDQVRGALTLGCMTTLAPMLVPEIVRAFGDAYPGVQLRSVEGDATSLFTRLARAEIDVALAYDLGLPKDVAFEALASLPPHVIVSEGHRLANAPALTLRELQGEPLILLDLPHSRDYFQGLFLNAGLEPTIGASSASQDVVRSLVANGHGYGLFNARPRADVALDGRRLIRIRLAGSHRPMRLGVATLAGLQASRLVAAFVAHCRACISDGSIPGMVAPLLDRRAKRAQSQG